MTRVEGFAAIPNWMIRESDLSIYAIAVYGALASHTGPGGIHPGQPTLAREARCSERQVRNALNELEALGVVERVRRKNEFGRAPTGYMLYPHGRLGADEEAVEVPARGAATSEVPASGAGGSGMEALIAPLIEEEPNKKPSVGFAEFYMAYPRKVGKEAARRAFERAVARGVDPVLIVDGARRYAQDPNLPDKQFIPHPASWLNAGRWDDEPEAPRSGPSPLSPDDLPPGEEWAVFNR